MSGRRPWNTGCYLNGNTWKKYQKPGEGLTAQFLKAGYSVYGGGKIYHSDQYFQEEWTEYMDHAKKAKLPEHAKGVGKEEGYHEELKHDLMDEDISDWHTVNFCIDKLETKQDKPFFLACGLHKPHLPFAVPRKYYGLFPLETIQLPPYKKDDLADIPLAGRKMNNDDHARFIKDGNWKNAIQSYLATCAYCDMNIGRLLDAFDKSPYKSNTIIILWGDHGWSFGEKDHWRKFALWEEPTRAPLIYVAPGVTKPGTLCERTVDFMTIYPTLCELANIPVPAHVEGKSTASLLKNPQAEWQMPAITTHGFKNHTVRTESYRYIRYADGSEELYDEQADPYEWTNLADKPDYKSIKLDLAKHLPTNDHPAEKKDLEKKNSLELFNKKKAKGKSIQE
jgi:arylsulfatase A-like enzyme